METYFKRYSILISCPSDVQEELEVIKEAIDNFNKTIGEANNVFLVPKHWSTHSYPESGGKPQDLLNKQLVIGCDAAVAVFWTRFGTATDKYGSGTEEEIALLLGENKQVFLYFSNIPISPSEVDSEQYEKVKEFQKKSIDKGLYHGYDDLEEFRKDFTNHLNTHFLKEISESEPLVTSNKTPDLNIKGINNDELIDKPIMIQRNLKDSQFIENLSLEVENLFNLIKNNKLQLPKIIAQDIKDSDTSNIKSINPDLKINVNAFESLIEKEKIEISEVDKKLIKKHAENETLKLDEEVFFNIGSLGRTENMVPIGGRYRLSGSDEEKDKYNLIYQLIEKIECLNQWITYFKEVDSQYMVRLAIANNGTTYDEDVDIKLFIEKGNLVKRNELPMPGNEIIENAIEIELIDKIYKINETYNIEEFVGDQSVTSNFLPNLPPHFDALGRLSGPSFESLRENFKDDLEGMFEYNYFQDKEFDILSFNIPYIKQNTNIAFPTALVFNSEIEGINIEINSKYSSEVIKKRLKINTNIIEK